MGKEVAKELTIVKTQVTKAVAAAREISVVTGEDAQKATDLLSKIKSVGKMVAEKKAAIIQPINEALRQTRELFAPIELSYNEAERIIKEKILAFHDAEADRKRKEAEKIAKKVEDGKLSFEKGAEKVAAITVQENKIEGARGEVVIRTVKDFEVVDESKVPDQYWVLDTVAIRKDVMKGVEIPGVKVIEKQTVAAR